MPSATKSEGKGTKRKSEGGKDGYVKKAKVEVNLEKREKKVHVKAPKVKKVVVPEPEPEEEDESSSDDMSEDGGAILEDENVEDEEEEEQEEAAEATEGMHPDRVRAATQNGAGPNGTLIYP